MPAWSTSMSIHMLRHVWHVRTAAEARAIALRFANIGLGRIEGSEGSEKDEETLFILHDLQYAFCVRACDGLACATADSGAARHNAVSGHALLLSSCESLLGSETAGDGAGVGWARFCFAKGRDLSDLRLRQYLGRNMFRHLCAAAVSGADGAKETILGLLFNFLWLRGRTANYGHKSVLSDCAHALGSLESISSGRESQLFSADSEATIYALRRTLMRVLVGRYVSLTWRQ